MSSSFVHLHVHSEYSLLDGAGHLGDLIARAKELGMEALALTDHGTMYGILEFYQLASKNGIKPIVGCEVYLTGGSCLERKGKEELSHLVLLAENPIGYRNLLELVSFAHLEGFYYKPRIDREVLARHAEGLIALSGCAAGEIPRSLLRGDESSAREAAAFYREVFPGRRFYLEVMDHGLEVQRTINKGLLHLASWAGLPLVATNDVHYIHRRQARVQDVLLCIQTGQTLETPDRLRFQGEEFFLKGNEEMAVLFSHLPEALSNTMEVADRCNLTLELGGLHLPSFPLPNGETAGDYLRRLAEEGIARRFGDDPEPAVQERLWHELQVIGQMGYEGYFLILWDVINFARQRGIPVGPGRGSAAGSLVAFLLGITDINPLAYGLLFERFLNPDRVTLPDIDTDFCFERRGEVIEYLIRKYGSDHVAQIATFGTLAARAAVRDVGRVMGIPLADVDRVAKMIPAEPGSTLERALAESEGLKLAVKGEPRFQDLLRTAMELEGTPRHVSTHAAGVVVTPSTLTSYLPLQKSTDGGTLSQYSMHSVEELGLLKMDILGLRTLTVIGYTLHAIKGNRGLDLDQTGFPFDDPGTYEMMAKGETVGVFQLESPGMRSILRNLRPSSFEDLIALIALYRPGPLGSGMIEDFIKRKQGQVPVAYPHPLLEGVLRETYGVIVYQEQVMRIANELAGFTLSQADVLRRAMGKKKPEVLSALKAEFVSGAMGRGVEEVTANEVFELMSYFAGYGFNKSHSAAYAVLTFRTAYLKRHYPREYMAALLTSVMDNPDRLHPYLEEVRHLGISLLPPDINKSGTTFEVCAEGIRYGLAAVRNVGRTAVENIVEARGSGGSFVSIFDFCDRADQRRLNRRALEALIKAGAFDCLVPRGKALTMVDSALEAGAKIQEERRQGQLSLFSGVAGEQFGEDDGPTLSVKELLVMEKESLGFFVSTHPLERYDFERRFLASHRIAELRDFGEGKVDLFGLCISARVVSTRQGADMAYFILDDGTGDLEVVVFPSLLHKVEQFLQSGVPLAVTGNLQQREKLVLLAGSIMAVPSPSRFLLDLSGRKSIEKLEELKGIVARHKGVTPLVLDLGFREHVLLASREHWVSVDASLENELAGLFEFKVVADL